MSDLLLTIVAIARLALRRHGEARAQQPKRGATPYLRAALRAARQMASLSKTYPDLLPAALEIIDHVICDARDAEAALFALGANSSAYLTLLAAAEATRLTLLAAAEATRLTLLDKARRQTAKAQPSAKPTPAAQPARPKVAPTTPRAHPQPLQPKSPTHAKPSPQHPHHYRKAPTVKLNVS